LFSGRSLAAAPKSPKEHVYLCTWRPRPPLCFLEHFAGDNEHSPRPRPEKAPPLELPIAIRRALAILFVAVLFCPPPSVRRRFQARCWRRRRGKLIAHRPIQNHRNLEGDASESEGEAEATVDVKVGEGAEGMLDFVEADEFELDEAEVTTAGWEEGERGWQERGG
jgi:hypothetical protein